MGQLLLEAMQVGSQIAAQRNQRLAQEEARRQRQAEAMALADYRREQLVNQARDDDRARRQAEALADYHKGQLLRQQQADIDAASNRKLASEDRAMAQKDKSGAAAEKLAEQMAVQKYQDAFQEGMTTRDLSGIDLQDESIPLDQFSKPRTTMEAFDYAARKPGVRVPADMLEKRMTAEMAAERMARPPAAVSQDPQIYEKDGYMFYQGRYGPVLMPGQRVDDREYETQKTTEPGTRNTTTRKVKRPEPEKPATPEQTAALAEFYARRSAGREEVVPAPTNTPPRSTNAPAGKGWKPQTSKPKESDDGEKVEVINPQGQRKLIRKSQLKQALEQDPPYTLPK